MNLLSGIAISALLLTTFTTSTPQTLSSTLETIQIGSQATTSPITFESPHSSLFDRIAQCESQDDPHTKNPSSTASGRFQFLWGTWNRYGKELWGDGFYDKNIWNYIDNTELAWYIFSKYGTKDWNASKSCWGGYPNTS